MTLNGVLALILRFSPNSITLLANYVMVVEGRHNVCKILFPSSSLSLLAETNGTLQRGLSATAELLVLYCID